MPDSGNPNIWRLPKHNRIRHVLMLLHQDLGDHPFQLLDIETLNEQSIRLGSLHSPATAYLYTYGQQKERYGLQLEYPMHAESNVSELEETYEDLSYQRLLETIKLHLQIEEPRCEQHGG